MSQFLYFYFYCYILAQVLYIFVLTTIVALFISCVLYLLFLISYSKIGEKILVPSNHFHVAFAGVG